VTHAETIHLSTKTEGAAADVIKAAYEAAQAAMRAVKAGNQNWEVTSIVDKVAKEFDCVPVVGMLSCQHEQNVTDGKKRILLNPTPDLKRDHETVTFEEGEVYGVDVLVVTGTDGKVGGPSSCMRHRSDTPRPVPRTRAPLSTSALRTSTTSSR
jgi:methionine aminopeptidase